jgi:rhodanese-related sulfurtransferase
VLDVEARWIDDVDDAEDLARYASGRNEPTGDEVSIHVDVNEISVHTLDEYRQAGAPLIDVRQPDEYTEAHVPGAKLIPMDQLPEQIEQIPTDTPVYLICATGVRSYRAAEWLTAQGFDASNVSGGTRAWIEAGKAVVAGPDPD